MSYHGKWDSLLPAIIIMFTMLFTFIINYELVKQWFVWDPCVLEFKCNGYNYCELCCGSSYFLFF